MTDLQESDKVKILWNREVSVKNNCFHFVKLFLQYIESLCLLAKPLTGEIHPKRNFY